MSVKYESLWWKAVVPDDWESEADDTCVTFTSKGLAGAVQVSAAAKDDAVVTDADLAEFAGDELAGKERIARIRTAKFRGIEVEYADRDRTWRKWWLRSGRLLLYVTYNTPNTASRTERALVDAFIADLEPSLAKSPRSLH